MKAAISAIDIQSVFDAWRAYRPRPDLCRLTTDRAKLIRDRLALGYSTTDLRTLVQFVFEAEDDWCSFMRGRNDRGTDYTGLDSILRREKLADRVERALLWRDQHAAEDRRKRSAEAQGVDLGLLGSMKNRLHALPEA